MNGLTGKILMLKLYVESTDFIYNYTGKLSKAIVLSEAPSLEYAFKPVKGFYKPLRISPPIKDGKALTPTYGVQKVSGKTTYVLKPVKLSDECIVEVGATEDIVDKLYKVFKQSVGLKTRLKFENALVNYLVKEVLVIEPDIVLGSSFTVSTSSPVLLPNPFTPSQHIRRFTVNPSIFFWVPYMIAGGNLSHSRQEAYKALIELESCLTEHYSTKYRVIFINYDNNREPALEVVRAKYLLTFRDRKCEETVKKVLYAARVYGVGASRASGFGSIKLSHTK